MRTLLPLFVGTLLGGIPLCACALVGSDHLVECAGSMGADGFTVAGPHVREGHYYSKPECFMICEGMHVDCAPVIEQHTHHHGVFRCGPSGGDDCGPRHTRRPNVRGPCDSEGFDRIISAAPLVPPGADAGDVDPLRAHEANCDLACGPRSTGRDCHEISTLDDGRILVRCGEDVPDGCPRPQPVD
jgi:hypothetical protein